MREYKNLPVIIRIVYLQFFSFLFCFVFYFTLRQLLFALSDDRAIISLIYLDGSGRAIVGSETDCSFLLVLLFFSD